MYELHELFVLHLANSTVSSVVYAVLILCACMT
jgi:hypothetical protein